MGLCVPRTCTFDDIKHILDFSVMINDNLKANKTSARTVQISNLKRIEEVYDVKRDPGALVIILFTVLLSTLVIAATIIDIELFHFRAIKTKSMSFDLERPPVEKRLSLEAIEINNLESRDKGSKSETKSVPKTHCCAKRNKQVNVVDLETLTINNINNSNNINLVTVKKVIKPDAKPPSITLDVVAVDELNKGCKRCGKYKKQCASKESDNLTASSRINKYNTYEDVNLTQGEDNCKKISFLRSLLLCFSLKYSLKRIFNTNLANRDLFAVHIMKIIALE